MADSFVLVYVPILVAAPFAAGSPGLILAVQLGGTVLFLVRDALFGGAGPGKRLFGLRVVRSADGEPVGYGQAILRWLSQFIPIFNLIDAFAPAGDPFQRRYGDRWARTRVIDTVRKLEKARSALRKKLARKGFNPPAGPGLTIEQFARLA